MTAGDGSTARDRVRIAGAALGPAAFVTSWLVAGALRDGYDPVATTISHLAAEDAPRRWLVTGGLLAFGVLVPLAARPLARGLGSPRLAPVALVAGVGSLAVAATPLSAAGGQPVDTAHVVAAAISYTSMAASPLVGSAGATGAWAQTSRAASAVSAAALTASLFVPASGLMQRIGLTVVDAWYVSAAWRALRKR